MRKGICYLVVLALIFNLCAGGTAVFASDGTESNSATFVLGNVTANEGTFATDGNGAISLLQTGKWADSEATAATVGEKNCYSTTKQMYFAVSSQFMNRNDRTVKLDITYYDNTTTAFNFNYQNGEGSANWWKTISIPRKGENKWVTKTIVITDAYWPGNQANLSGLSFRVGGSSSNPTYIERITITKTDEIEPLSAVYYFDGNKLTTKDVALSSEKIGTENSFVTETVGPEDDLRVAGVAENTSKYLYFRLDSNFITQNDNCVKLKVTYLDNGSSNLNLTYQSTASMHQNLSIPRTSTGKWMQRLIYIYDAKWPGRQQGVSNVSFRIGTASSDNPAYISCVEVSKTELSNMPPKGSASITFGDVYEVNSNTNETIWIGQNEESCQGLAQAPDGTQAMYIESGSKYIWVCVSSKYVDNTRKNVAVRVTYYDDNANDLSFSATTDAENGMFGYNRNVKKTGSNSWKTADFYLTDAAWPGRMNGRDNCSFRVGGSGCYVKNITLMKYEKSDDISASVSGSDETVDPDEMLTATAANAAEYIWLAKDGKQYVSAPSKNGEYSVSHADEGKTFAVAAIKADGTVVLSNAEFGPVSTLSWVSTAGLTPRPENFAAATPKKNVFKTEDSSKEFILLDVKNNNESKFLVLSKDFYGQRAFTEGCTSKTGTSDERKFDPENEKNVAYWLNNDFLVQENTIPSEIQKHINFNHYWKTEPQWYTTNTANSYAVKAGIALMSAWEQEKYITEFGYMDSLPKDQVWLLRTAYAGQYYQSGMAINTGGERVNKDMNSSTGYIRPEFHLNRSFFKEVKIDLTTAGSNVIKAMKDNYTIDELKAIYSEPELVTAFDAAAQGTDYAHISFENGKTGTNISVAEPSGNNDAVCTVTEYENEKCCALEHIDGKTQYMYFITSAADGDFNRESRNMSFYIKYLDNGTAPITLQYNSGYNSLISKDYKEVSWDKTGTGEWLTKKITVTDAKFGNKQNHNADFRLVSSVGETLYISSVMVSADENNVFESVELLPQAAGSVFENGIVSFNISIYKNNSETEPYNIWYSIKDDITGKVVSEDELVEINAENKVAVNKVIKPEITKNGVYTITADIECGERTVGTIKKKFGVANYAQDGAMKENSPFGINVHSQEASSEYFDEQTELLSNLGFKTIRDCYTQSSIEQKGWGELSAIANAWINRDGKWCSILGGKKYDFTVEENVNAFASYCGEFAAKYPQIETFEILNEPDISAFWSGDIKAAAYANVVKKASEAIKAANPNAKVVAGAAGNKGNGYSGNYVGELFENGIYSYIDAFSHHPYFRQDPKDGFINYAYENGTKELEAMGGWKEVYLTETGVSSAGISETKQAEYDVKTLILADIGGYDETILYNFIDTNDDPSDWNGSLGIMYSDFTPKPAMIAVAQLNSAVAGAPFVGSMDINGVENYLFDYNGTPVMVAWASGAEEVNAAFAENVTVKDMYGNTVSTSNTAKIGSEPVYIYGISADELAAAAKNTISGAYADWKTAYGELSGASETVDRQTALINGDAAALLSAHYEAGKTILGENSSNGEASEKAMLAMDKWQSIGERIAAYCGAVSTASEMAAISDIPSADGFAGDIASFAEKFAEKASVAGLSVGIQNANAAVANGLVEWTKTVSGDDAGTIRVGGTTEIKDASGNKLDKVPSDKAFTVNVPLQSSFKTDKNVTVVCGIYGADKKLLKASVMNGKTLSSNNISSCEFSFDASETYSSASVIRVFVIENLESLKPETSGAFEFTY